jgi:phosphate transport system substrate-binding protein
VIGKTYPIARELFMFTNGQPTPDSLAAKFIGLSQTEKGREIVEEIGFVPVPEKK